MCEINVAYLCSLVNSRRNREEHIPGPPGNRLCSLPRNDWQYKTIHVLIGNCSGKGITKARSNENSSPRFLLSPKPAPAPSGRETCPTDDVSFCKTSLWYQICPIMDASTADLPPRLRALRSGLPSNVDSDSWSKPWAYANYRRPRIYFPSR